MAGWEKCVLGLGIGRGTRDRKKETDVIQILNHMALEHLIAKYLNKQCHADVRVGCTQLWN